MTGDTMCNDKGLSLSPTLDVTVILHLNPEIMSMCFTVLCCAISWLHLPKKNLSLELRYISLVGLLKIYYIFFYNPLFRCEEDEC